MYFLRKRTESADSMSLKKSFRLHRNFLWSVCMDVCMCAYYSVHSPWINEYELWKAFRRHSTAHQSCSSIKLYSFFTSIATNQSLAACNVIRTISAWAHVLSSLIPLCVTRLLTASSLFFFLSHLLFHALSNVSSALFRLDFLNTNFSNFEHTLSHPLPIWVKDYLTISLSVPWMTTRNKHGTSAVLRKFEPSKEHHYYYSTKFDHHEPFGPGITAGLTNQAPRLLSCSHSPPNHYYSPLDISNGVLLRTYLLLLLLR